TLVEPRIRSPSLNRTKMRLLSGANDTLPVAAAKIPKVGVAAGPMKLVTLSPAGPMHPPDASVWQSAMVTGRLAGPVSAETVMVPGAPTFTVATAKAPTPLWPGTFKRPSLSTVAANATMSGTGVADAEN